MSKKGNGFIDRTGESRVMRNGHTAVIVAYRNTTDIDIEFPDLGAERTNMHYNAFKAGSISPWEHLKGENHTGETLMMKCGIKATVVAYRRCDDVDVLFESGELVENIEYRSFVKGNITPKPIQAVNHVGESKTMSCGHEAIVVCYRKYDDIDVEFPTLGITKTNVGYGNFIKGHVNPYKQKNAMDHIGEIQYQKTRDMNAKIICYRKSKDIDVEFVKDGKRRYHMTYYCFERGKIRHPDALFGDTSGYKKNA